MTDPSSFGTALWTLLIVAALVVALGLAAVSDMAMRRREDRAARNTPATGPGSRSASHAPRAPQAGATAGGAPDRDAAERR
ncbi:histidine kinase [Nocardiopsis tropica]|uniref:histidine kinase n=1 Tax=Nocardiopsis tropica TaxID=109330 RepID=UPI002E8A1783|nr:histidine kinase [Nocardiopsis tropica]